MTMMNNRLSILAVAACCAATVCAQDVIRSSSSIYLPAWQKADVTISFDIDGEGKRFYPTWGLDQAWMKDQNLLKGINHMGKENIGIGRSAFRFTDALQNDSVLAPSVVNAMKSRNATFDKLNKRLPIVFTADQEAGTNEYFVKNKSADIAHWAAMINSHVHWMQANTEHPVVGISPFNEGDYWTVEEGATATKQWQVAKLLKEQYPRCADIPMVGGNTLNNDKALEWYSGGKGYYDWGNTHQLAGSFDSFAAFFQQLAKDGKVGYADEMHNVGEAMVGLEYGMTVGIWWGFDSRARGEFCQFSRHGERLAYGEHRANWTAASVYRHDDGRVKAFIGSSERQAATTNYQLVSPGREVYYDGYGPVREYLKDIPGGTGYRKGQTNAERVIDVTWGEDVQPSQFDGVYKLVNKKSKSAVGYSAIGGNVTQMAFSATNKKTHWTVKPCTNRTGGDLSFYDIESVDNAKVRMNVKNYATTQADIIAWQQDLPTSNEQWYLEYAGEGYYYLRNRESALYLASAGTASTARLIQTPMLSETGRDRMLWRLLPLDVAYETVAPAQPQGLVAEGQQASVRLSWTASQEADLAGYMVLRAEADGGAWNTIARKLPCNNFVDHTCRPGTSYIYKVKAIDKADNLSPCSETAAATPTGQRGLLAQWLFEDNLYDESPNMMDAATNLASTTYANGRTEGKKALNLFAGNRYVQLPYEVAASDEMTITLWVKWSNMQNWQRIFDFGNDPEHYMFLTPANSYTGVMRFAIKNGGDEQTVDCKQKLPLSVWKHVAVVIGNDSTTIYIDGQKAGSSTGITIKPSDIHPSLNYIGRSQFSADPYFRGYLDECRIYNYALSADDVVQDMEGTVNAVASPKADHASSHSVYGLSGQRYDAPRQGLNIIDGRKTLLR